MPTLNDEDKEIIDKIKTQRTQRGRMNLEVMKQLIKEQQKADALSESSSSSESSLEDDSPSVIHP
jgi:hypothetical protein